MLLGMMVLQCKIASGIYIKEFHFGLILSLDLPILPWMTSEKLEMGLNMFWLKFRGTFGALQGFSSGLGERLQSECKKVWKGVVYR